MDNLLAFTLQLAILSRLAERCVSPLLISPPIIAYCIAAQREPADTTRPHSWREEKGTGTDLVV